MLGRDATGGCRADREVLPPIGPKTDPNDSLGPLAHQLRVFLIDSKGEVRNICSVGFLDPRLAITDVRTVLAEREATRGAILTAPVRQGRASRA